MPPWIFSQPQSYLISLSSAKGVCSGDDGALGGLSVTG